MLMVLLVSLDLMEFRDPDNLPTVVYRYSVMPYKAAALCVAPPSTLFCVSPSSKLFYVQDQGGKSSIIRRLDCSGSKVTVSQSIKVCDNRLSSLSYLKYYEEELLVVITTNEMQAFKLATAEVKWSKNEIQLPDQNEICKPVRIAAGRVFCLYLMQITNASRCSLSQMVSI